MFDIDDEIDDLNIPLEIEAEIRAINGGYWPRDKREYDRAAQRFGCVVMYYPRSLGSGMSSLSENIIYVPELRADEKPGRWHRHELSEACARWEGREPLIVPERKEFTKHDVARRVDMLDPFRPYLTQDLERKISQCAGVLAQLIEAAGFQSAYITLIPGEAPHIDLGYKTQ